MEKKENWTTYDHVLMRGVHRVDNGNLKQINQHSNGTKVKIYVALLLLGLANFH